MRRIGSTIPYPGYAWRVVRNSALLWLLLRLMLALMLLLAGVLTVPQVMELGRAIVAPLVPLLVWLEARRHRETLFHANLGTHPAWVPVLALGVVVGLELLVGAL